MQEYQETELAKDISMSFPEDIWALNPIERYLRARTASEFCTLDESRYFIRSLLPVPLKDENDEFLWGVWCEVSQVDHDRYLKAYVERRLDEVGHIKGWLANDLPAYDDSLGLEVEISCSQEERPRVKVLSESSLKVEQNQGIDRQRHQEIDFILFGDCEDEELDEE